MSRKLVLSILLIFFAICVQAQSSDTIEGWLGDLKGGVRIQKAHRFYWENGVSLDFASPKIAKGRIHFGLSYVTSRLGSALGSNAIKQDNYLFSTGHHFRQNKRFQPFARLNMGYFRADYEVALFDVLPNQAMLISLDGGLCYEFKIPLTVSLSGGYNFISGNGIDRPGTLYPFFYQLNLFYTIFKHK